MSQSTTAPRWSLTRVFIIVTAIVGVSVLLYPTAASWFSDRTHATEISGYVEAVNGLDAAEKESLLQDALAYNNALPTGPLRDPYSLDDNGEKATIGSGSGAYLETLSSDDAGMMGSLDIPSINAHLPIFHTTSDATLAKGVGHLFGSSLPVGGIGSHSVLTAHSGFVNATLFDNLKKMKTGDVFSVTALGETIYYKVDQILTVLPSDTDALRRVEGKDYVTLVTCTPTGVNTHRLLVRGVRIDAPEAADADDQAMASSTLDPGFPWWAVVILVTGVGAVLATRPRRPKSVTEAAVSE